MMRVLFVVVRWLHVLVMAIVGRGVEEYKVIAWDLTRRNGCYREDALRGGWRCVLAVSGEDMQCPKHEEYSCGY